MRVLLDYRPALRERTGVGEYVDQLARALVRLGREGAPFHLTLFSSSWKDRLAPDLPGAGLIDRRVPVRLLNLLWHRLEWPPVERLARQQFDVVHAPHPLLLPARRAAQVVTVYDLDFLDHPERTRAEIRRDYPTLAPRHARRAHSVVVSSAYTARQVHERLGVPADRIVVVPGGAPPWPPRAAPPAQGYILFVGTLTARKNVPALLDAYRLLLERQGEVPDLVLAGRAEPEARAWLTRLAHPPLAGRVRHLGYVAPSARQAIYTGAALLVLPSFEEGFGLPAVEAMTVGVPVVASTRGALPEVVGEAGVLVDPNDVRGLAEAMARLVTDEGLARTCIERGFARAARFSWDHSARALVEAYQRAIERYRAGAPCEQHRVT